MRRFLCLFVLCAAAALPAAATVTLTANLKDLGNGSPGQLAGIQLQLAQCPDGFPPHTAAHNTGRKSQLFPANDAGDVVIALDGNDEITCEALGNSRWNVFLVFDGGTQFYGQYNIKLSDGASQNLKNLTPITPPPTNATLDYALRNADNTFAAGTKQDLSGAGQTLPMKAGTAPPATCVALKEMFIDTDAAAGARILKCAADGVSWIGIDDSGIATSVAFSGITGGTNSSAAMVVGTGASLATSGSGTIAATSATTASALAANGANCPAGQAPLGVSAAGASESCADYMEEPAGNGIVAKTAANTSVNRTLAAGSTNLAWTNADGVAGDPSIDISANVALYNAGSKTWGGGSAFTWTFDGGANTDPTATWTSGTTPFLDVNTNVRITGVTGTATDPNFSIRSGTNDNGMFLIANGQLGIAASDAFIAKTDVTTRVGMYARSDAAWGFISSTGTGFLPDTFIMRDGAPDSVRIGDTASATPAANSLTIGESSRAGTDVNLAGANGTLRSGTGTGNSTATKLLFQTPVAVASGSGAQTQTTQLDLSAAGAVFTPSVTAPSFIGALSGNANTATALAGNGGNCAAGQAPLGVDAAGVVETCTDYMEEPASSGIVARTAANTSAARTFAAGSSNLVWTNGDGVAGNPSVDVGANVALYNAGDKTWGAGSAFTWTFDGGANTDPSLLFTSAVTPTITTNSLLLAPNGVVGAPAYSFANFTNQGMWSSNSGLLNFSANGSWIFGTANASSVALDIRNGFAIAWSSGTSPNLSKNTLISSPAAATVQLGAADVNGAPVAQTFQVQNAITGTDLAASAQFRVIGPLGTGAGATSPFIIAVGGKQATGTTAHAKTDLEKWIGGTVADPAQNEVCYLGTHGEQWCRGSMTELLTLSTSGTTTDTTNNLLPADAIIKGVEVRITTTIATATNWSVGDATTAARFCAANATLTAGTTSSCLKHYQGSVATDAAGPVQSAAAKVRITTTGTPSAGIVRILVDYERFIPPTS